MLQWNDGIMEYWNIGLKVSMPYLYFVALRNWLLAHRIGKELKRRLKASKGLIGPPWNKITKYKIQITNIKTKGSFGLHQDPLKLQINTALIKSFVGVQGAVFQKSPLAAGGKEEEK